MTTNHAPDCLCADDTPSRVELLAEAAGCDEPSRHAPTTGPLIDAFWAAVREKWERGLG